LQPAGGKFLAEWLAALRFISTKNFPPAAYFDADCELDVYRPK